MKLSAGIVRQWSQREVPPKMVKMRTNYNLWCRYLTDYSLLLIILNPWMQKLVELMERLMTEKWRVENGCQQGVSTRYAFLFQIREQFSVAGYYPEHVEFRPHPVSSEPTTVPHLCIWPCISSPFILQLELYIQFLVHLMHVTFPVQTSLAQSLSCLYNQSLAQHSSLKSFKTIKNWFTICLGPKWPSRV